MIGERNVKPKVKVNHCPLLPLRISQLSLDVGVQMCSSGESPSATTASKSALMRNGCGEENEPCGILGLQTSEAIEQRA